MALRTISDEAFLNAALELFRAKGFEGVSLKQLADATGLEKASLYHRYPGGKDEIVLAVAAGVVAWLQTNVFSLLNKSGPAKKRVSLVCEQLRDFYANGSKSCITDVLSLPGGSPALREALKAAMAAWVDAFAGICRECGFSSGAAKTRAEEVIYQLEGSLVVSRVLGDNAHFQRVLQQLPRLLTTPAKRPERSSV